MVTTTCVEGRQQLAVTMKGLDNLSDIIALRNALAEVVGTCLSCDETKDSLSSYSLFALFSLIGAIDTGIHSMKQEKGGEI